MALAGGTKRPAAREDGCEWSRALRRRAVRRHELHDVCIDLDLPGVEPRGDPVVAVENPIAVAEAQDVDRRQDRETIDRRPDPLPTALPVEAPERLQREEVAPALRDAAHGRAGDEVDIDLADPDLSRRRPTRVRMDRVEVWERFACEAAQTADAGPGPLVPALGGAAGRADGAARDVRGDSQHVLHDVADATDERAALGLARLVSGHRRARASTARSE